MAQFIERPFDRARALGFITSIQFPDLQHHHHLSRQERALEEFLSNFSQHVLYEDTDLLIVNKPAGVVSHAGTGHPIGVEEVARYYSQDPEQLTLAHRIDMDTSGVLMLTKTSQATRHLRNQFAQKTAVGLAPFRSSSHETSSSDEQIEKIYITVLDGLLEQSKLVYVGLEEQSKGKVAVHQFSNPQLGIVDSLTHFVPHRTVRFQGRDHTLSAVLIVSGRKHQIRAVAEYIGFPVTGDRMYGSTRVTANRQLLHARQITFTHPRSLERMTIEAPLPDDFKPFIQASSVKNLVQDYQQKGN